LIVQILLDELLTFSAALMQEEECLK